MGPVWPSQSHSRLQCVKNYSEKENASAKMVRTKNNVMKEIQQSLN
jgi:hypothetical protein